MRVAAMGPERMVDGRCHTVSCAPSTASGGGVTWRGLRRHRLLPGVGSRGGRGEGVTSCPGARLSTCWENFGFCCWCCSPGPCWSPGSLISLCRLRGRAGGAVEAVSIVRRGEGRAISKYHGHH